MLNIRYIALEHDGRRFAPSTLRPNPKRKEKDHEGKESEEGEREGEEGREETGGDQVREAPGRVDREEGEHR